MELAMEVQPTLSGNEERATAPAAASSPRPSVIHSCTSAATGGRGDDDDDDDDEDESWDLFESPPATPPSNDPMPANDPPPPPPIADLPIPTKKRGRARKPSDPKDENVQVRESLLEVGSAVYAPFPGKNPSHERTYTLMSNSNGAMMIPFLCTIGNIESTHCCLLSFF